MSHGEATFVQCSGEYITTINIIDDRGEAPPSPPRVLPDQSDV